MHFMNFSDFTHCVKDENFLFEMLRNMCVLYTSDLTANIFGTNCYLLNTNIQN